MCIPQIATQIYTVLDKTMIGSITHNMEAVGFYEQAQNIMRAALMLITSLGTVVASRVANIYSSEDSKKVNRHIYNSFNFVWAIAIPMIFGIIAISPQFVPLFYGDGYTDVIPLLSLMSILILVIGLSNVSGIQYLIPIKKQKEYTTSVTMGCIVNVITNFILIKFYGVIGAVIASIIAEITVLLVQILSIRKNLNIKLIFKMSKKYLISSLIMFGVIMVIPRLLKSEILNMAIEVLLGVAVYSIMLLILKDRLTLVIYNKIRKRVKNK